MTSDPTTCTWTEDSDGNLDTDCGQAFTVINGTPAENGMKFCCYCGKGLVESRFEEPKEPADGE